MLRVARFVNAFVRPAARNLVEEEVVIGPEGSQVPATLLRPSGSAPLPGWIVLHGMTVPGRAHPLLLRFARALARSGAVVLMPEVPPWRSLRLDAAAGHAAITASAAYLRTRSDVVDRRYNLIGFSFGATQALMSAAQPQINPYIGAIIGFGAYCDLGRTVRFMIAGEHEWQGQQERVDPDPYGRWIVAGNFLTMEPEFAHMNELAAAALELARETGLRGTYASDISYDPFKRVLRESLPHDQRELWDILAPPGGPSSVGSKAAGEAADLAARLADKVAAAASTHAPHLDPAPVLHRLDQPIALVHGREDRLIPYTESLRLGVLLEEHTNANVWITRLFAHSRGADRLHFSQYPREVGRYLDMLRHVLHPA